MRMLMRRVQVQRPDLDVRLGFLDLNAPSVADVLDLLADEGRSVIAVPLLLGSAFHARVDLPALLQAARERHSGFQVAQADVLGTGPHMRAPLLERISETGGERVLVAAVGSSDPAANQEVAELAEAIGAAGHCFATTFPEFDDALERGEYDVVAPWFLAPGLLLDRIVWAASARGLPVAQPLGPHPAVAAAVVRRYDAALPALELEHLAHWVGPQQ